MMDLNITLILIIIFTCILFFYLGFLLGKTYSALSKYKQDQHIAEQFRYARFTDTNINEEPDIQPWQSFDWTSTYTFNNIKDDKIEPTEDLKNLEKLLQDAIDCENFEAAALYRDLINKKNKI